MPTYNRRRFVSQAIWYFLRQDYAPRELIIIDDGDDAIGDLVPDDERIHYVHHTERLPTGAKRNLACEMSHGELIAHWDDDDWIAPQRLSVQVAELAASDADICGARELLYYHLDAGEAWLYHYPAGERPWLAGGTLLYRRSAWTEHPFPDSHVGEDSAFVWQFSPHRLHAVGDTALYVATIHAHNTGAKNLDSPRWQRRPLSEISQLLAFDRDFYVALRNDRPYHIPTQSQPTSTVTVAAPFIIYDGYGSMAEYLVMGMARAGAKVNVAPLDLDPAGLTEEFLEIAQRSQPNAKAPVLYFCWPRSDLERFHAANDLFINTMWESSQLPAGWAEQLNRARAVIVPTQFVAQVCQKSGVAAPIEVIPEGIDPEIYHYERRPNRPGFTTLIVGTVVGRKHTLEGIAAWKQAFADDADARLIIKSRFSYGNYVPDNPRIRFVDTNEPTRGIAHWYQQADVLLALGNEGFGLPLVEGMATGLPVIALNSEGQADICEEASGCLLPVEPARWEPYEEAPFGRCGVRGIPGVEDVTARLRWVAAHRAEARDMGRAASDWVFRHRNVWAKSPAVLEVMERYIRPARPLRRIHTFWVPSWHSTCGIAEYTAHLSETIPSVRITGNPPDMRGVRLLHVQHEHSLFSDVALTRYVQQARRAHVPVAITEHTVVPRAHAWERDADVLVALTQKGADWLQTRWPTKRVEHIPHGCPTWFPPCKQVRGRVIGVFGFLGHHKGFWNLLDVLREVPGTELLMFSHAKSTEIAAQWEEAAEGLPVRRNGQFLPAAEVARRLAAEADVLVFWYDDITHASASGAVRVGLATGVPVLTSPTSWFSELRDVTYQPEDLIEGVQALLENTRLRKRLVAAARDYCNKNSWARSAERHLALWQSIED
jgi:glycosyltransferase involved in cell wall biosynthesis